MIYAGSVGTQMYISWVVLLGGKLYRDPILLQLLVHFFYSSSYVDVSTDPEAFAETMPFGKTEIDTMPWFDWSTLL